MLGDFARSGSRSDEASDPGLIDCRCTRIEGIPEGQLDRGLRHRNPPLSHIAATAPGPGSPAGCARERAQRSAFPIFHVDGCRPRIASEGAGQLQDTRQSRRRRDFRRDRIDGARRAVTRLSRHGASDDSCTGVHMGTLTIPRQNRLHSLPEVIRNSPPLMLFASLGHGLALLWGGSIDST